MEGASYRKWVSDSLEKGAGPAHAWTRQTDKAPPLPEYIQDGDRIHYDPIPKAEYFARMWAGYWAKEWDMSGVGTTSHVLNRRLRARESPDRPQWVLRLSSLRAGQLRPGTSCGEAAKPRCYGGWPMWGGAPPPVWCRSDPGSQTYRVVGNP